MKSDFEIIIDILKANGSLTAREIAKSAKDFGKKWETNYKPMHKI
jgi:hypothetical protein